MPDEADPGTGQPGAQGDSPFQPHPVPPGQLAHQAPPPYRGEARYQVQPPYQPQPIDRPDPLTHPAYRAQPPPAAWHPARKRVHALWLAAALVAAIVAGSGGYYLGTRHASGTASGTHRSSGSTGGSGGSGTHIPAAGPGPCAAAEAMARPESPLLAGLLPTPPGASRPASEPAPRTFSLQPFVARLFSNRASETAFLAGLCFKAAVNGEWQTQAGTLVSIYLVQFAAPDEARSFALSLEQADTTDVGARGRHAAVSGVPDGMIIQDPRLDKFGNTLTRLIGDVGDVTILFHVYVPANLDSEGSMEPLLRSQAGRL